MDGFDELKKPASSDWYEMGKEAAKEMTRTEGQNVVWNLGYFRQGILDVIHSKVVSRDSHPDPEGNFTEG
jgi:diadenosine tetraphosphate (Ap4A) HIT family hydrolase